MLETQVQRGPVGTRIEQDFLGPVEVPADRYFGGETQRSRDNFQVSGLVFPRRFIRALGIVKWAAARANEELGLLDLRLARAIRQAAEEMIDGRFDGDFVVDVFQTGSGTSTHMNANEVLANRAIEILGGRMGSKSPVHPHDHVNRCQSSNDVFPTAIHVAAASAILEDLVPALEMLRAALEAKAREFADVVKLGRTHLMDAVPMTLGQEFSGYASQVEHGIARLRAANDGLLELALGATAVGTGLAAPAAFATAAIRHIRERTGHEFRQATNPFEALAGRDAAVHASGALRTLAVSLMKIANDLRLLSSGPRSGLGEITLPPLQPGSSIMPGKVNPVIPEMTCQVAAQVIGNDAAIAVAGQSGLLELNVMMPLVAYDLLQSIGLVERASRLLAERTVAGIAANRERCRESIDKSLAMVTALSPRIGYDRAARIAQTCFDTGKTVREICREEKVLPDDELDRLLDPLRMTRPGFLPPD